MDNQRETGMRCAALRNEAWRRGYCVITRDERGRQTSRAYSVDSATDFSETRETELKSLEAVMGRLRLVSTEDTGAPPHPPTRLRQACAA